MFFGVAPSGSPCLGVVAGRVPAILQGCVIARWRLPAFLHAHLLQSAAAAAAACPLAIVLHGFESSRHRVHCRGLLLEARAAVFKKVFVVILGPGRSCAPLHCQGDSQAGLCTDGAIVGVVVRTARFGAVTAGGCSC